MGDRTVSVSLMLKVGQYVANAGQAAASTRQIIGEVDNLGKTSPSKFNAVTAGAAVAGGALLGMAGYAVKAAMDFDKQMSEVGAVSNATGRQMEGMRALAIQAGKDTSFSATEAAQAEAELAKAGITTADIMGGALKGSLSLAAAGQMGLADAATIAAQTMNIFELKGKDVAHIADVLASAANVSAADMHGLGLGLQQVGLVAHQAGFSLEETTGMLAAFADRGLQGSDGATSLKTAIQRLVSPIPQVSDLMSRLGIEVYDTSGHVKTAAQIAGSLQTALGKLSIEERNTAMNTIFGSDAIRAANVLYTLGEDGVKKYTDQVNQNGAAAETAGKKMDNLSGDLERLKGSIETVAIQAGSSSSSGLRVLAQTADHLVGSFADMNPLVSGAIEVVAGLSGAGLLAFAGLSKVHRVSGDAAEALRGMGPAGEKAATGLTAVSKWGGRASVALAAVQVASALVGAALNREAPNVDRMANAMQKYAESGERAGELTKIFGKDFQQFGKDIKFISSQGGLKDAQVGAQFETLGGFMPILGNFDFSLTKTLERMHGLDEGLANMVKSGHAQDAAKMFEILAAQANNNGVSAEKFRAMMPGYTGAIGDMAHAADGAGNSQQTAGEKARTMAAGLDEAMRAAGGLKNLFDQLNGVQINLTQAQINVESAVQKFTQAIKESSGSLDVHNEKGRAAAQSGIDLANTAAEVAQKTYDQTHSVEQARGVFETYRQQLINNIATAGGTKQATDESRKAAELLASQIMQMPEFKQIPISLPGIDAAIEKIVSMQTKLNGLQDRSITVTTIQNTQTGETYARTSAGRAFNRWGGLYTHAAEGALRDANIYQAVSSGARYAFAERETEGEFFGPKRGNLSRTRAMATYAVENWWGGQVTWGSGGQNVPVWRPSGGGGAGGGGGQSPAASGRTFTIENFHATPEQSPHRIAEDLWFLSEARGGA